MRNLIKNSTTYYALMFVTIGLVSTGVYLGNNLLNKQASLYQASSGSSVCFQRITQTFTSLMIKDFSASYLSSDFRTMTSECLDEVSKIIEKLDDSKLMGLELNNLKSDYHWFDQKVLKVKELALANEIDILQSNISNKYGELEGLKNSFDEKIQGMISSIESTRNLISLIVVMGLTLLCLSIGAIYINRKLKTKNLEILEENVLSQNIEKLNIDDSVILINKYSEHLNLSGFNQLVMGSIDKLQHELINVENTLLKMNTIKETVYEISESDLFEAQVENNPTESENIQSTEFHSVLNTAISRVEDKAFNDGIILDTDLANDYSVNSSNEALEQLLYYSLSFAMDKTAEVDGPRKLTLKSNPLGAIAYLKLKLHGCSLADHDISILNGKSPTSDTNVNLLLLRELVSDANSTVSVKNIKNSQTGKIESELEFVFERARDAKVAVKVVKGSKADIKNYFKEQTSLL